ncbi:hypothetical protein BX600DRAFT_390305 [Xylariales sp. PMI_506]|nr:hypothetical protein BX600DRAFT_390305 [Xylariales sp. PMI_506]
MVGVGGRSRACDNCRRRRIKCDLTSPECNRCIKARLKCGGSRQTAFIHFGSLTADQAVGTTHTNHPTSSGVDPLIPEWAELGGSGHRLSIPYEELFLMYTRLNLLHGEEELTHHPGLPHGLTRRTFLALSTTYFGIEHQENRLVQSGLTKYGQALGAVSQALADPSTHKTYDLLLSIFIMSLFEFLIGEHENGWVNHARGIEKLLELRGPESMTSLSCLKIMDMFRAQLIFAAMILHDTTIFSRPEWKEIPWSLHPERKDAMQLLLDIAADGPQLLVLCDRIDRATDVGLQMQILQELADKTRQLFSDLEQWNKNWTASNTLQYTEIPAPETTPRYIDLNGQPILCWSTVLFYESWNHVTLVTLYSSMVIFLGRLLVELNTTQGMDELNDELQARIQAATLLICRSVDYQLETLQHGVGSLMLLFPLRMAHDAALATDPVITAWLKELMTERIVSGTASKWGTSKYVLDIRARRRGEETSDGGQNRPTRKGPSSCKHRGGFIVLL